MTDRQKDRQTREVNIRVAKAERSRTNNSAQREAQKQKSKLQMWPKQFKRSFW